MSRIENLNIVSQDVLVTPRELKKELIGVVAFLKAETEGAPS